METLPTAHWQLESSLCSRGQRCIDTDFLNHVYMEPLYLFSYAKPFTDEP
jgi:hypothetical protein